MTKTILVWLLAIFFLATTSVKAHPQEKVPRIGFLSTDRAFPLYHPGSTPSGRGCVNLATSKIKTSPSSIGLQKEK